MKSNTLTPFDLFGNQVRYTVPLFQRPYVWNEANQWQPLWDDVRTVVERILENKEVQAGGGKPTQAVPHFLGAIVLDQKLVPTGFIQERHVIDGQQRLTTLQLLMDAAQEVVAQWGTAADASCPECGCGSRDWFVHDDVNLYPDDFESFTVLLGLLAQHRQACAE